jgi:hypothetical protein
MTDLTTQNRLVVYSESKAWPYLWAPLIQIEKLKELFDRHQIRYYVEDFSLSRNNGPEIVKISFGRNSDPIAIQNILDEEQ